jgi:DNA integrity scanning protein DisA with diadenylate cyclase activity
MLLTEFAKSQGATKMAKVVGEKGAFISCTKADGSTFTIPVGKRSQTGTLKEFNILIAENGQAIATVNSYTTKETLEL